MSTTTTPTRDGPLPPAPPTSAFEIERQRHVRAARERLPSEVEKVTWPLARLHRLRDERLRALVRTANARSPWHARRLRRIEPATLERLRGDDLSALPTMTKADLMAHWDEIVTDRRLTLDVANTHLQRVASEGPAYLLGEYTVIASGGSTGTRGVFVWDFGGWLTAHLALARHTAWEDQHRPQAGERRRASVGAEKATHGGIDKLAGWRDGVGMR
jgi:phenylacetate-coenzyme A ligase PaaK-like adenylate-forming protein